MSPLVSDEHLATRPACTKEEKLVEGSKQRKTEILLFCLPFSKKAGEKQLV